MAKRSAHEKLLLFSCTKAMSKMAHYFFFKKVISILRPQYTMNFVLPLRATPNIKSENRGMHMNNRSLIYQNSGLLFVLCFALFPGTIYGNYMPGPWDYLFLFTGVFFSPAIIIGFIIASLVKLYRKNVSSLFIKVSLGIPVSLILLLAIFAFTTFGGGQFIELLQQIIVPNMILFLFLILINYRLYRRLKKEE